MNNFLLVYSTNYNNIDLEFLIENYFKIILFKLEFYNFFFLYKDRFMPPHFLFSIKTFFFLLAIFGIRAIIPRYRYDQVSRVN